MFTIIRIRVGTDDTDDTAGLMSGVESRKTRSSQIFEVANEALHQPTVESTSRLPPEYLGVPLVDNDLPGNEVGIQFFKSLRIVRMAT